MDDQAQFSNLINELIRNNYHQVATSKATRPPGEKGRANSEK